ncbi:hypothetical protein LEP1GSC059_4192 [Leptospira noguchii serovar Panama str. CZ214]|uniref:Uncharacterized protein n=1 Tax=Leptospira noguchii serovar Panama str. CZ214 TaxID=1001595 RepID=T0FAL6_9LEPT|nr:hypothetical protein LEP1GSC059_4192 [Leptospira noguchii serovar Panama str. CZ214]
MDSFSIRICCNISFSRSVTTGASFLQDEKKIRIPIDKIKNFFILPISKKETYKFKSMIPEKILV